MESSFRLDKWVLKLVLMVVCVAITSMFFFPFEFRFWEGMNTKRMLAAIALVILLFKMIAKREPLISKDFLYVSLLACVVSFCGLLSVTLNNTPDYTYATYITSAWVWWGAAYTACWCIRLVHGKITWVLVINYLTAVCVFQCFIALAMDLHQPLKDAINSAVLQEDLIFEGNIKRLYGIGATLDVAGTRFAAILVMIMYLLANSKLKKKWYEYVIYLLAYIFITVAGNMIARTTLVGTVVGLIYLLFLTLRQTKYLENNYFKMWQWMGILLLVTVPAVTYLYQTNNQIHKNLRFGFEGFFNYVERGDFSYSSGERLATMYEFPDNMKTWVVGDGYFDNPRDTDPYYTGKIYGGFYKGTDVGYLRFIFYFGVIGLLIFSWYFIKVGQVCMHKFPQWKVLFLLLLLVHFIVWAKVSTDIFLVFAMFLCLDKEEEEDPDVELELEAA